MSEKKLQLHVTREELETLDYAMNAYLVHIKDTLLKTPLEAEVLRPLYQQEHEKGVELWKRIINSIELAKKLEERR